MQQYIEEILKAILDSLEECMSTLVIASGKKLLHIFYITLGFLALAIVSKLCKYPTFISIPEASIACIVIGLICGIDLYNQTAINNVKKVLSSKKRRR